MEAQALLIVLHDDSAGYEITPDRVPLSALRSFARDVDEFLRGDGNDVDTSGLDVAVVAGSLALRTAPVAHPTLIRDLRSLAHTELLNTVGPKRRAVVERWQRQAKAGRAARHFQVRIEAAFLVNPVVIGAQTDFHTDEADQWVRVERYVQGEIFEMGGLSNVNAHLRLADGSTLLVAARRDVLSSEPNNRLFKQALLRIAAEYNVSTREHRNAQLIEFVPQDSKVDERGMARLVERGTKAWADVPQASAWVDELRGSGA